MNQYKLARLTVERIKSYGSLYKDADGKWSQPLLVHRIELSCSCTEPLTVEWFKTEMQNFSSSLPSLSEYEARYTESGEMHSHLVRLEEDGWKDKRSLSKVKELAE